MHPQGEVGVVGPVGDGPPHVGVDGGHPRHRRLGLGPVAEGDGEHGVEGAAEAAEGVGLEVAVVDDARRHQGVGHLEQERRRSAGEDRLLPHHPPHRPLGADDAGVAGGAGRQTGGETSGRWRGVRRGAWTVRPRTAYAGRHVDEDLAHGAGLDRGVGVGGALEGEAVEGEAGLLAHVEGAGRHGGRHVADRPPLGRRRAWCRRG